MKLKNKDKSGEILQAINRGINEINSFDKDGKKSIDGVGNFWNNYGNGINLLIRKKLFSRLDFDNIKEGFNNLIKVYNRSEGIDSNFIGYNELFRKICLSFFKLSFQFNEYNDNYLKYFDPSSSYYKRIKSLLLVRGFRGKPEEFLSVFSEVTTLLYEVIELDPQSQDYCIELGIDCLNILFLEGSNNTTVTDKINTIVKYCNNKFANFFLQSKEFDNWIVYGLHKYDDRENDEKGIREILNSIIINGKLNENDQKIAYNEVDKYIGLFSDMLKIEKSVTKGFINFLKASNYYSGNNIDSLSGIDVEEIYEKVKHKHFGDLIEDRDFHVCTSEDANDIKSYFGTLILNSEVLNTKNLIAFADEQPKGKLEEIRNELENLNGFEFLVFNMPKDLRILYNIVLLQKDNKLGNIGSIVEFSVKMHILVNKLKSKYPKEKIEEIEVVKSDNKDIEKLLSIIEDKDRLLHEKEIAIERYIEQSIVLRNKIDDIYESLKKRGISLDDENNNQSDEEVLIEKRSYYKIIVIGGSDHTIKGFKNLMKNNLFIERLDKHYHLKANQFELKGTYDMQKDKKFTNQIQDGLDFGSTDFVIVLQSDHETALANLIDDPYYSSRITCFGELDEEGKISKINQKFSPEKFDLYLEKALKKYEKFNDTNSNLLAQ